MSPRILNALRSTGLITEEQFIWEHMRMITGEESLIRFMPKPNIVIDPPKRTPPTTIEILLHCYYSPEPVPRVDTEATRQALRTLRNADLIEQTSPDCYSTTDRGTAWVEMICATPYPVQRKAWVDPRTQREVGG